MQQIICLPGPVEYDATPMLTGMRAKGGRIASLMLTPELAGWLLDRNGVNRHVRRQAVENYKADILAGRWTHSDSMLALDSAFRLRNGQHRCLSVVETGLAIPVVVLFDATDAEIMNMDAGVRRVNADILTFAGRKNAPKFSSALRTVIAIRNGTSLTSVKLSRHELPALSERHIGLEDSCTMFSQYNQSPIGVSGPITGVHYIASTYMGEQERADLFMQRVVHGAAVPDGSAEYVLRNHLLRLAREPKTRKTEQAVLVAVVWAWNHARAGRSIRMYRAPEHAIIEGLDVSLLK